MADDNNEIEDQNNAIPEPQELLPNNSSVVDISKVDDSPEHKRETTRSEIAKFYVCAFFMTIAFTFFVGLIKCFEVKDYRDMLITVSGILSGPLGFIIGYYFKTATSKD
jgi:hypothetical protein